MAIKDENYYVVQAWMATRLNLKGIEKEIYAIIYSFTQNGEGVFDGSLTYLSELTGASTRTVMRSLDKLVERGLLEKQAKTINGVKLCEYKALCDKLSGVVTNCQEGIDKMSPGVVTKCHTINNTNDNIFHSTDLVVEEWNKLGLTKLRGITPNTTRYIQLNARLKTMGWQSVIQAIRNIDNSSFLKGQNKTGWVITFDWFIKPNNFIKVLEGNYLDKEQIKGTQGKESNTSYDIEKFKRDALNDALVYKGVTK